jgi:ATP-dependent DNA helicase RecQ
VLRLHRERNQRFGAGQSIDILLGRKTDKVLQHRHEELTVFGIGTELQESEWRGVVRQLLAQGLLAVQGEHGTLALTDASAEVLGRRREVMMRREPERAARSSPGSSRKAAAAVAVAVAELSPDAAPRFEALRAWRAATAKEQGVPAYVIFHDATLREIAAQAPDSLGKLRGISGVGENKLAKYGEGVLETLAGM